MEQNIRGALRFKESALRIFRSVLKMTDIRKAFQLIAPLVENSIMEECVESAGESEYEWEDCEIWNGRPLFLEERHPLWSSIETSLPPGTVTVMEIQGDIFVIEHVPEQRSMMGNSLAFIRFRKAVSI